MSDTDRVARWRQRMRDEGKEPITIWLSHDEKLRLEDLARTRRCTTSAMVAQALAQFHPGSPDVTATVPDTAQLRMLMQEALLETTAVTELVTDIVTATLARDLPPLVQAMFQDLQSMATPRKKPPRTETVIVPVSDTNGNVSETELAESHATTPPDHESEADHGHDLVTEPIPPPSQRGRKLTPRQIRALRDKHLRGVPVPALMDEYGLSRASVFRYLQSEKRQS